MIGLVFSSIVIVAAFFAGRFLAQERAPRCAYCYRPGAFFADRARRLVCHCCALGCPECGPAKHRADPDAFT